MRVQACLLATITACASANHVSPRQTNPDLRKANSQDKADAIRDIFVEGWNAYYQQAYPADELAPESRKGTNYYNGWSVTLVDSLTTAALMGLEDIVHKSLEGVGKIDYTKSVTDEPLSLFETNIRHLASLLSTHDLLTGPLTSLVPANFCTDTLLSQAKILADTLKYAFDTPTGIPHNTLFLNNRTTDGDMKALTAEVGTLLLEWQKLSDKLGDPSYAAYAARAERYLADPESVAGQHEKGEPWPGLLGIQLNISDGQFLSRVGGWVGGIDSFYEYLLKLWVYDPNRFEFYKNRWILAADSTMKHLLTHPTSRPTTAFLALHNGTTLRGLSQIYACFAGGNFILAGITLNTSQYIDFGLSLADGCAAIHNTQTRLPPTNFKWIPVETEHSTPPTGDSVPATLEAFYLANGFWPTEPSYSLNPEPVESWYYAYRATRDDKWRDRIWSVIEAINGTARAKNGGFSAVNEVNKQDGGGSADWQPSFFFAETLKYAWLAFAGDDVPVVVGRNGNGVQGEEWVFNTEGHPMRTVRQ